MKSHADEALKELAIVDQQVKASYYDIKDDEEEL